ncbi:MAG: IS21-like element IS100 family transposase [Gammaproteobacteria bacterium]
MLIMEQSMSIKILYQQGYSKKRIARELDISINTVRKYLTTKTAMGYKKRPLKPLKLDPFRDYIQQRLAQAHPHWIPATVIYREIIARGYTGKIATLRNYMYRLKPLAKQEPVVRFETAPGEQMQVDWAEFRKGTARLAALVATLGYSRMTYVHFVSDEPLPTLLRCHEQAFDYFGGVPHNILYDNMKTVISQRDAYGEGQHRLHAGFWDFSKHYGFIPTVCRPYRAQTKGKVERFIRYLRDSFYHPLVAELRAQESQLSVELANTHVVSWLNSVANQRIHGTTGESPHQRFPHEQLCLQALPAAYRGSTPQRVLSVHPLPDNQAPLQHDLCLYDALIPQGVQ